MLGQLMVADSIAHTMGAVNCTQRQTLRWSEALIRASRPNPVQIQNCLRTLRSAFDIKS